MMLGMYEGVLSALEQRGWHSPRAAIGISPFEKVWWALKRAFL